MSTSTYRVTRKLDAETNTEAFEGLVSEAAAFAFARELIAACGPTGVVRLWRLGDDGAWGYLATWGQP